MANWVTSGNAGTTAADFLGTPDGRPLVVKTNGVEALRVDPAGHVGIGTTTPQNQVHIGPGSSSIEASRVTAVVASESPDAGIAIAQNSGTNLLVQASGAGAFIVTTSFHPLILRTNDADCLAVLPDGNVQIGQGATSIAADRVNASIASTRGDGGIAISQNSGVNVLLQASGAGGFIGTTSSHPLVFRTADQDHMVLDPTGDLHLKGDIVLENADCAEEFDVSDAQPAEPGTVMVLCDDGSLAPSQFAYDTRVAGVVSGAGTYRPAIVLDRREATRARQAIALVGKVFCKVDATVRPVKTGDMLTSAEMPGHAMLASDRERAFGAVIGKALTSLEGCVGLIPIMVALQ